MTLHGTPIDVVGGTTQHERFDDAMGFEGWATWLAGLHVESLAMGFETVRELSCATRRVAGCSTWVYLEDATIKQPTEKQLERVGSGAREVCTWITGTLRVWEIPQDYPNAWRQLVMDPKRFTWAFDRGTAGRVDACDRVFLVWEQLGYGGLKSRVMYQNDQDVIADAVTSVM